MVLYSSVISRRVEMLPLEIFLFHLEMEDSGIFSETENTEEHPPLGNNVIKVTVTHHMTHHMCKIKNAIFNLFCLSCLIHWHLT